METSGYVPSPGTDLSDLTALVTRPGPVATVFLTTEPAEANAAQHSELRWRAVRESLAAQGAPDAVLDAVGALVPDAHHDGRCLAVVAGPDGVRLRESHQEPPAGDRGRWAPLPSLGPVIEWRQGEPSHLLVLINREGADLIAFRPRRAELVTEVKGEAYPVHDSPVGGWSQRRYQSNVQGNWRHNAAQVTGEVADLAKATDAQVLVVAGDVRARELFVGALPAELAALTVQIDGSRAPDGSEDLTAAETVRAAAGAAARHTTRVLAKFREERGQRERAADGPAATVDALRQAQVALLLAHDDQEDGRTAWFGPEPGQLGTTREDLEALGVAEPLQGRLVDVVVRAALGTGADVRVVPAHGGPQGGVGAILRWS